MNEGIFSIANDRPPKYGLTISAEIFDGESITVTAFSLGGDSGISQESYDTPIGYLSLFGSCDFLYGRESLRLKSGDLFITEPNVCCGAKTLDGAVYVEIIMKKEFYMNKLLKPGEVIRLADLVPYEKGGIVNMDVVSNETTKFAVMAFDEGCALSPHRAPGDALVFALEGKAVIGYEGKEYPISAGENFRFEKNGLHSVKADGKFKMALLLTLK